MNTENYTPVFADLEELQVLLKSFDELAGAALDGHGKRKDSALWLISKCSQLAVRDIEFLVKGMCGSCHLPRAAEQKSAAVHLAR